MTEKPWFVTCVHHVGIGLPTWKEIEAASRALVLTGARVIKSDAGKAVFLAINDNLGGFQTQIEFYVGSGAHIDSAVTDLEAAEGFCRTNGWKHEYFKPTVLFTTLPDTSFEFAFSVREDAPGDTHVPPL